MPKRKIPKDFVCLSCGMSAIRAEKLEDGRQGRIICGRCGFDLKFPLGALTEAPVDLYCTAVDYFELIQNSNIRQPLSTSQQDPGQHVLSN